MVGSGDANSVAGFEAAALFTESMTVPDAVRNGQAGSAVLHFSVDGSLAVSGGSAAFFANYQKDGGPIFTLMTACLYWRRPIDVAIPTPPPIFVGPASGAPKDAPNKSKESTGAIPHD
jgi:hypothetical protein